VVTGLDFQRRVLVLEAGRNRRETIGIPANRRLFDRWRIVRPGPDPPTPTAAAARPSPGKRLLAPDDAAGLRKTARFLGEQPPDFEIQRGAVRFLLDDPLPQTRVLAQKQGVRGMNLTTKSSSSSRNGQ
jgi:hypothetical protein